jgi:hypothetical protein
MVGGEGRLDSVFIEDSLGKKHHAGAVDDDVDLGHVGPGEKLRGCFSDRFLLGEIELESMVCWARELGADSVDAIVEFGWTATGDDEMGWGL